MNAPTTPLAVLKTAWLAAKAAEAVATERRREIEDAILTHFPTDKTEGSITDKDAGVTCTYKLTRKVADSDTLAGEWMQLSKNAQSAFRWKAEVDTKQFKALQDLDPEGFAQVAQYVTTTPAKATISIKE